jgi:hypothetical protein
MGLRDLERDLPREWVTFFRRDMSRDSCCGCLSISAVGSSVNSPSSKFSFALESFLSKLARSTSNSGKTWLLSGCCCDDGSPFTLSFEDFGSGLAIPLPRATFPRRSKRLFRKSELSDMKESVIGPILKVHSVWKRK